LGTTFWFDLPLETGEAQLVDTEQSWTEECNVVYLEPVGASETSIARVLKDWGIPFQTVHTVEGARKAATYRESALRAIDALIVDSTLCNEEMESLLSIVEGDDPHVSIPVILIGAERLLPKLSGSEHDQIFAVSSPVDKRVLFNTLHACYSRHSTEDDVIHFARKQSWEQNLSEPLSVLIGDDNSTNRLVLQRMLDKMGYHSIAVSGGEAVLTALEHSQYDIAIVDKNMPDMSGIDVFTAYKMAHGGQTSTQFIILTADATPESKDNCMAAGIEHFLTKPVSLAKLQDVFNRIITRTKEVEQNHPIADNEVEEPSVFPVVDDEELEKLKLLAGDDDDFMRNIITNFENDAKRDIRALELAVASHDWLAFKDSAHALKGAAMYLGFHQLAELTIEAQVMDREAFERNGIGQIQSIQQATNTALQVLRDKLKISRKCG
jgi:two-component system sensor histidine kinase RpfC